MFQKFTTTVKVDGTIERGKRQIVGASSVGADMDWEKERLTRLALREGSTIRDVEQTENTIVLINMGGNVTIYHWINVPANVEQTAQHVLADTSHDPIEWNGHEGFCGQCGAAITQDLKFHGFEK